MSLWKLLLTAYGSALLLFVLWGLGRTLYASLSGGSSWYFTWEAVTHALLSIGFFVFPITLLGYGSTSLIEQRGLSLSRNAEQMLRISLWLGSGVVGSLIAYELLLLVEHGRLGFSFSLLTTTLTANILVVLFVSVVGSIFSARRRGRMLHKQEKLLTDEFRAAYRMQQSLLPEEDVQIFGFDISGAMLPAVEIGGDYYDYLSFADGSKGILVADASGKGVPAALIMAKFQGMARALSIHVANPNEFFVGLNDTLRVRLSRQTFITVGMMTIDFEDHCTFWRAGHNSLFHWCADSGDIIERKPQGIALGLTHGGRLGSTLQPEIFDMGKNDVVLLYSDGLTEAVNEAGEEFGEKRLKERLKQAASNGENAGEIRSEVLSRLSHFVGQAEEHDDITIVVVKRT
ncbi:MAG: SpoIIE family protein phosphatase [Chlorobi bacterium]|nr:SpoIIE family protein phosphatase [Chlorobiota bacterium]